MDYPKFIYQTSRENPLVFKGFILIIACACTAESLVFHLMHNMHIKQMPLYMYKYAVFVAGFSLLTKFYIKSTVMAVIGIMHMSKCVLY